MRKNEIVGIGANVFDTLYTVEKYPTEDTKMRAESIKICGGGPCATGIVAASKLGASCAFIGNLSDDNGATFLKADFEKYGVDTDYIKIIPGYETFCSVLWLSKETTSRTCVFFKGNVPPTEIDETAKKTIADAAVLMIDGNDMAAAIEGAKIAKNNGTKVLYDAGGLYEGVENLLPYADILIPSEEFSLGHTGAKTVEEAAKILYEKYSPEIVVITQGKKGGIIFDGEKSEKYPAFLVDAVDSNGSGDVFHGAFAFAVTKDMDYKKACVFSSAVSALKCTKVGAREGVPTYDETINFLKENNYEL
ncbi:MAG: carbohydrate kinase family protein [Ruminococcaceae bacterium]|nr:carbohydrate kinase family protein [Oscillospiraceae bacterium]